MDESVRYIERTRLYYRALGYKKDYQWAQNDETGFTLLSKPLHEARVGLVTTSAKPGEYSEDSVPEICVWSQRIKAAPKDLYNQHLAWDKETTHTRDRESYIPINAMLALAEKGIIGSVAPRFHGVPTVYSQRETIEQDAPNILQRLRKDEADAALLVAL